MKSIFLLARFKVAEVVAAKIDKGKNMDKFYCQKCQKVFEAEGVKREYSSPIYGPCWKWIAKCPDCDRECDEFRQTGSSRKKNFDFDSYVANLRNRGGGCGPGSGCCG